MSEVDSTNRFKVIFNSNKATHDDCIERIAITGKLPYVFIRGLRTKEVNGENVPGYNESLPTFQDKSLEEWIRSLYKKESPIVRFADIGYGAGHLLLDLVREFEFVHVTGFGRDVYTRLDVPELGVVPTYDELTKNARIRLVEGNLPFSETQIPSSSQEIVVCNNVLQYVRVFERVITQDIHRILIPGGIALLNQAGIEETALLQLLNKLGVKSGNIEVGQSDRFDIGRTLAFMK